MEFAAAPSFFGKLRNVRSRHGRRKRRQRGMLFGAEARARQIHEFRRSRAHRERPRAAATRRSIFSTFFTAAWSSGAPHAWPPAAHVCAAGGHACGHFRLSVRQPATISTKTAASFQPLSDAVFPTQPRLLRGSSNTIPRRACASSVDKSDPKSQSRTKSPSAALRGKTAEGSITIGGKNEKLYFSSFELLSSAVSSFFSTLSGRMKYLMQGRPPVS